MCSALDTSTRHWLDRPHSGISMINSRSDRQVLRPPRSSLCYILCELGPSSYIITAGDLHPITPGNRYLNLPMTYLVVPEANTNTRTLEIGHIRAWSAANNLALNCSKSKEMIIRARGKSACPQPPWSNIERVTTVRVLSVIVNNQRQRHVIAWRLTYAAPAWSGACSAGDRAKLDAFVNRCWGLGYCSQNEPSLTKPMDDADERLFRRIMNNSEHVLQPFLPDRPVTSYNLRRRPHCNKSLWTKTVDLSNNDYIIRATYKDSYWHCS